MSDDVSGREFQLELAGGQWSKGKCYEGFNPLGPVLVPAGELPTADLKMRSFANSEIRQDSSAPYLICGVEYLVRCLSEFALLEPGGRHQDRYAGGRRAVPALPLPPCR